MLCKIKILKRLEGVYTKLQPEVGKVYDAHYAPIKYDTSGTKNREFCVIDVKDKRIVVRRGEFELVEG